MKQYSHAGNLQKKELPVSTAAINPITVAADQRYRSQIWVVAEVVVVEVVVEAAAEIAAEVLVEVAGGTELDLDCGSGDP